MALVRLGMQGVWVIPIEYLRSGGMIVAPGAAETFGAQAQIDHPAKERQVAQQTRLVQAVALGDRAATAAADGARQGALDREDELAIFGQLGLEDANIRDIKGD